MMWRWFWREWRSPSLIIVWISLTLAVACVLALGNISIKMDRMLALQNRDYLAGDKVLRSTKEIDTTWLAQAEREKLKVSHQRSFMAMAYANDKPQLVLVKAVDSNYPLYGVLETKPANSVVEPDSILVSAGFMALTGSKVGDQIEVADANFIITGELVKEPDAGYNPFEIAPRVLMNLADIDKTGAAKQGARLSFRYMFAGEIDAIERFSAFITPKLTDNERFYGIEGSGGNIAKSLQRAKNFLLLSALLTLLLAIAAITIAMSHYCRSRYDLVAILKTLGANKTSLTKLIAGQWLVLLFLAIIAGVAIGLLFEQLLLAALQPILPEKIPSSGWQPLFWSIATVFVVSLLISIRPYMQMLATQPLRVLRNNMRSVVWPLKFYLPIVVLIVLSLLFVLVGLNKMLWMLLIAIFALAAILGLFGWVSLKLLQKLTLNRLSIRLSISRLLRQPLITGSQLSAFSLSFMLLALIFSLRGGLIERWQQQLPPDSPNYFLINIDNEQISLLDDFFNKRNIKSDLFYPVVRMRLTQINSQSVKDIIEPQSPGFEAINRELNLTSLTDFPPANKLVAGYWPPNKDEVSVEEDVAKRLGLKLGDSVSFSGGSFDFMVKITSIRKVNWESLRPNFYFIFPTNTLEGQTQNWITSFYYNGDSSLLTEFNREFPTITVLDINNIIGQISNILNQVSSALEIMLLLVIICGALLLFAQVQVGMRQRYQELVVYRTLGASNRLLRSTLWNEFALLGFAAGLTATVGAEIALWLLQTRIFDFSWQPNQWLWVVLPLTSMFTLSLLGVLLSKRLISSKGIYRHFNE